MFKNDKFKNFYVISFEISHPVTSCLVYMRFQKKKQRVGKSELPKIHCHRVPSLVKCEQFEYITQQEKLYYNFQTMEMISRRLGGFGLVAVIVPCVVIVGNVGVHRKIISHDASI